MSKPMVTVAPGMRIAARVNLEPNAADLAKAESGLRAGAECHMHLTHERVYTRKEIWGNFNYFIRHITAVTEKAGLRIRTPIPSVI